MALISVTKESLKYLIDQTLATQPWSSLTSEKVAESILNYYTPIVLDYAPASKPVAFMLKDVISGELVPIFSPLTSERKCTEMKKRYFPTAQYQIVKLYEAAE